MVIVRFYLNKKHNSKWCKQSIFCRKKTTKHNRSTTTMVKTIYTKIYQLTLYIFTKTSEKQERIEVHVAHSCLVGWVPSI